MICDSLEKMHRLSNPPPVGKVSAKGDGFVLPYPAQSSGNAGPISIVVMANQISSGNKYQPVVITNITGTLLRHVETNN